MDFKQAKVAASHFVASAARTAQTSPFGGTAKASDNTGITPTNQSLLDTFNTIATEGVAPTFDPSSDPLRALRAAINGSKGISPDVKIPTVDQILKEVDKTGNSLVDGTLLQQYEDLKLVYTTERLALEDLVARGVATSQDVKDLKQFTKILTTLSTEIAEITKRQPVQKALYQQEIDALKAFGIKHANDKYQTISQDDIAQYDLNGDGLIGHPLEGSALYTGVIIGIQTIDGKDNYSFLDKATMQVVKFDPVTGEPLSTGISNLHSQWDLTAATSGLNAMSVPPEEKDMLGVQGVDASFKPSGHFLGERKASAEAQGTYNTQIDIPIPETLWVKNYPDGTLIEHDIEGGYKTETYLEGLDKGLVAAPPEDIREDYRQVTVAEVHVTSAGIRSKSDIKYAANGQVVTFKDTEGRILMRMLIGGLYGGDVDALGDLGKRLMEPSHISTELESHTIPASSFSMAFSAGYSLGDPNKMRKSPVKLTVDNNFLSTTNGGVYKKDGVYVPEGHLAKLKEQAVGGELKDRSAEYDTLSRFSNDDDSAKYIGPTSLTTDTPKNDGIEHDVPVHAYAEHGMKSEFVLDEANGPMAMGLYGNLKMGSHNAVVEEGLRPKNIDHLDVNWTSLVDMGGGYGLFLGQNGNHHIRNATQVFVKGQEGDQNTIHTKSLIEWDATVGEKEFYGHQAIFEAKEVKKYKDNPRVYVEVTGTVSGKTIIDNEVELSATHGADGDDYFDSMTDAGPDGTDNKNTTYIAQYADDEYNVNAGEVLYTNTEHMFDVKANAGNPAINSDAVLESYMEAEKKFEEFIKKDPTVASEGEGLEAEAAWEVYGPNYAEAQQSVTGFFDQYREQFGNPVPIDPALEPEPEADLDGATTALDKKMESTI